MLRINTIENTDQAIKYYAGHLTKDDYYAKDQIQSPEWGGELAGELKLNGVVTMDDYYNLMRNKNPDDGSILTQYNLKVRRAGYDFTFSVPKSMSLEFALNDNKEMLEIFNTSIKKTMIEIEKEALTRVRKDGQDYDRLTGNLIYANYFHQFARPDNQGIPDPHLHCHVIVANATKDNEEGIIKALQIGDIKKDGNYFQQIYYNYLAEELTSRGYEIKKKSWYFELANYNDKIIDKFSNRTKIIEDKIKELGITYADDAGALGAKTRNSKTSNLTWDYLSNVYQSRLDNAEKEFLKTNKKNGKIPTPDEKMDRAKDAIQFSVDKLYERSSVISYKRLQYEAMQESIEYGVNHKWLKDEFSSLVTRGEIIEKEGAKFNLQSTKTFTTKKVKLEEIEIIEAINKMSQIKPINLDFKVLLKDDFNLSIEQNESVDNILKSQNRIMVFTGKAGTGKTTTLKEIQNGIIEAGYSNHIFAPTTGAVDTLRKDGFHNALTLQTFLTNKDLQNKTSDQVIMIDEAGLISVPQANQILKIAIENNSRIIFVGDSAQHTSVERGDALRLIENQDKVTKTNIYSIRRQRGQYREATQSIAQGNILEGYEKLNSLGFVHQDAYSRRMYQKVAKDYVESILRGEKVGLYTPTHQEGKALIKPIRERLVRNNLIDKVEINHQILKDLNWEEVLKSRNDNYKSGMVLYFNRESGEFKKGDIAEVKIDKRRDPLQALYLVKENGTQHAIPLNEAKSFSVMEKDEIQISKGDKIVTTNIIKYWDENGNAIKLPNGKKLVIDRIDEQGNLFVKEDKKENPFKGIKAETYFISKNEKRINYGYYSTSHRGQGDTVEKAIIVATSKSLPAVNDKQFYVSTTRGRRFISIYTDNKEQLSKHIQKSGQRELAIEPTKPKSMTQSINKNQTRNIPGITRITKANQSQQDKGITMGV